ncbi:SPOR domain-containing protein [uncultured Paracoccus sp.]|uniref:SPOR domain-containing protein n=1 Tax=uncultured Paracoccus sp. TaxID=189685 RepID=UPI002603F6D6|nr:SPOR domain-containing protein [uncultured Paracoccus sp.]
MRFWILVVLVWPAASAAETLGPLEQPPEDFTGAQYIDSAGCVYLRQGSVWAPRLDRDGTVICGYPPSLPGLAADNQDAPGEAALRLSMTLAQGLRDADVLADPPDLLKRDQVETPRPQSGPLADLDGALRGVSAMRVAAAEQPAGRQSPLCDLLGYAAPGSGEAKTGQVMGFCGGGAPSLQPWVAADAGTTEVTSPEPEAVADTRTTAAPARIAGDQPGSKQPATETEAQPGGGARAPKDHAPKAGVTVADEGGAELIPAGARYVLIGRFQVPAEAEAAMLRLVRLGYPVARGRKADAEAGGRLVLVGPFRERQALVSALNQLRQGGYPKAVVR